MTAQEKKRYSAVEGGFSFLGAILAYVVVSVVASFVMGGIEDGSTGKTLAEFFFGLAIQTVMITAALLPARLLGSRMTYSFRPVPARTLGVSVLIAVVCVAGFEGISLAFNCALVFGAGYDMSGVVELTGALAVVLAVIRTVLVAPLCEETLFRGSVLSSLGLMGTMNEGKRIPFMVTMCGLMFALIHMNPMQTVYQFLLGCALAYTVIRFGSIIPAIVIHALNNAVGLVLSAPAVDGAVTSWLGTVFGSGGTIAAFVAVSLALAVGAGFAVRALCRKFGGASLLSPVHHPDSPERAEDFRNYADDGGSMAGGIMYVVGAIICVVMWVTALAGGLSA